MLCCEKPFFFWQKAREYCCASVILHFPDECYYFRWYRKTRNRNRTFCLCGTDVELEVIYCLALDIRVLRFSNRRQIPSWKQYLFVWIWSKCLQRLWLWMRDVFCILEGGIISRRNLGFNSPRNKQRGNELVSKLTCRMTGLLNGSSCSKMVLKAFCSAALLVMLLVVQMTENPHRDRQLALQGSSRQNKLF